MMGPQLHAWTCLAALALLAWPAAAQNQAVDHGKYPTRPIRIVSPFAAGSVSDISMRLFAVKLAARLNGQSVIALINRETRAVLQDAEIGRRFLDLGLEPLPSTPEELGARMTAEVARWARVISDAGIEKQ